MARAEWGLTCTRSRHAARSSGRPAGHPSVRPSARTPGCDWQPSVESSRHRRSQRRAHAVNMARSAAKKAAAKAKAPKPKASASTTGSVEGALAANTTRKRRQLARRDTDEKVNRGIESHFEQVTKAELASMKIDDKKCLRDRPRRHEEWQARAPRQDVLD